MQGPNQSPQSNTVLKTRHAEILRATRQNPKTRIPGVENPGIRIVLPSQSAMSTSIVDNASHSCGLLDQPNEVLHMIVAFLPHHRFVKFVDQDGVKRNVSQYLALAQVCKRLRRVVLEADLWQDPYFCFSDLLQDQKHEGIVESYALLSKGTRVGGLVKALLDDENFLNCVKRRKAWRFSDLAPLLMLVMSGSWFLQSAESVQLEILESEATAALRALNLCRQIKQLCIAISEFGYSNSNVGGLDLGVISECLPNLRKLEMDLIKHKGSLDLEILTNLTLVSSNDSQFQLGGNLLPLASRLTLRSLVFEACFSFTPDILNTFSNLTHLSTECLEDEIITTIKSLTNVRLLSFRTQILFGHEEGYNHDISGLAASQSLTTLKHLHLGFYRDSPGPVSESIMQIISRSFMNFGFSHLQTLEHLRLGGGFDLAWCPTLTSMKRLKCFELGIIRDAIGCTVGDKFYGMKAFPRLDCFKNTDFGDLTDLTQAEGLTAILEKEFESVAELEIWYVDHDYDFDEGADFLNDDFRCLCGEHLGPGYDGR